MNTNREHSHPEPAFTFPAEAFSDTRQRLAPASALRPPHPGVLSERRPSLARSSGRMIFDN